MMVMMMMMMGLPVDSGWVSKLATNTLKSRFHRRFLRRALRILTTPEQCTRGNQISPKSENRIGWTSRRRIVSAEHHLNTRCTLMTIVPGRAVFTVHDHFKASVFAYFDKNGWVSNCYGWVWVWSLPGLLCSSALSSSGQTTYFSHGKVSLSPLTWHILISYNRKA